MKKERLKILKFRSNVAFLANKNGAPFMAPHFCLDSGNIDDLVNLATEYLALHIPTEAHSLITEDIKLASGRKLNQQPRITM